MELVGAGATSAVGITVHLWWAEATEVKLRSYLLHCKKCSPPTRSWLKQNQTRTVVPRPKPTAQKQREECVDMGSIPLDTSGAKNMTRSGASIAKYSIKWEIYAPTPNLLEFFGQNILGAKIFQIIKANLQ